MSEIVHLKDYSEIEGIIKIIEIPNGRIHSISHDGKFALNIDSEIAEIWDLEEGIKIQSLKNPISHPNHISSFQRILGSTFSSDNKYVALISDWTLFLFEISNGVLLWKIVNSKEDLEHPNSYVSENNYVVAFTPDTQHIISAGDLITCRKIESGDILWTKENVSGTACSLKISNKNNILAVDSAIYFIKSGDMIRRFFLDEEDEYFEIEQGQVAISPEERFFAETFGLGATIIWDIDGNVIYRLRKPILESDYADLSLFIEFSHEGNLLASVSFDRYSIDIWDVNSGDLIKTITHDYEIMYFSFIPQTNNLVFSDEYNNLYFIDLVKYSYNKELFLKELVYDGESQLVEFKKSIRWDYKQNSINKEFEFLLVKDISALLNTYGGFLLLGVSNEGEFIGLEKDYETLVKNDRYGFSIHLIQTINDYIGYQLKDFWNIEFFNIEEKEICLIRIDKSPKPVFIRRLYQQEEFYIRTGSTTVLLTGQKLLDHLKPKKQTEKLFSQLQEFKELLSEFEVEIRNLIEKILSNEFDDWWDKCIQDQHKRRAIELLKREKRQDEIRGIYNRMYKAIEYLDFSSYKEIIFSKKNYKFFQKFFPNMESIKFYFGEISIYRNRIAHTRNSLLSKEEIIMGMEYINRILNRIKI